MTQKVEWARQWRRVYVHNRTTVVTMALASGLLGWYIGGPSAIAIAESTLAGGPRIEGELLIRPIGTEGIVYQGEIEAWPLEENANIDQGKTGWGRTRTSGAVNTTTDYSGRFELTASQVRANTRYRMVATHGACRASAETTVETKWLTTTRVTLEAPPCEQEKD